MSEAVKSTKTETTTPVNNQYPPVPLDNSKASVGVWLVKVPKYLAKKWNEAPDNAEVGRIRITQSRLGREVAFHLNEQLGQTVTIKVGDRSFDEKIPLEHKFITTPLGSQDVYIMKQQEEGAKEVLQTIGKVMQRAECVPITTDRNYLHLKRKTMKNHIEPKRQIKMADGFVQRHHYLPKSTHTQITNDKRDKTKRLRKDKDQVLDILFHAFTKHQYYNIKNLEKITQQPTSYLKDILHQICKYNAKGLHKNTWELKEEYKQGSISESKKTAVMNNINEKKKTEKKEEDYMDDDEEDLDDSDDDDDDDDDMIEQM